MALNRIFITDAEGKSFEETTMKNLAPNLVRQRVIIEGTTEKIVKPVQMKRYLAKLSKVLNMKALRKPFAYKAEDKGWGGWIHWITSGAHFYSYTSSPPLFTVDAYTCKPFSVEKAVAFTKKFLKAKEIVWKDIEI